MSRPRLRAFDPGRRRVLAGGASLGALATTGLACSGADRRPPFEPPDEEVDAARSARDARAVDTAPAVRDTATGADARAAQDTSEASSADGGAGTEDARAADAEPADAAGAAGLIDTHTHFWDTTRPGTPFPSTPNDKKLPPDLVKVGGPVGLTGTVVVEASGRTVDNDWILSLARDHDVITGFSAGLPFGRAEFPGLLDRYVQDRFFRGIRVSGADPWNAGAAGTGAAADHFARLAERDLQVDAHVQVGVLGAVAGVARRFPRLRVVIDHFAYVNFDGNTGSTRFAEFRRGIQAFKDLPNVFCKVSYLVEGTGRQGNAPGDPSFYAPLLDLAWDTFGEDRMVFGSNWPVCLPFASYDRVVSIVRRYVMGRGAVAARKVFVDNARAAYKFVDR